MPLVIEEGEGIQIRPRDEGRLRYAQATVTRVDGEVIDVQYEDGELEYNMRVSRARFWRSPVGMSACPFSEGNRGLAHEIDGYWYPGSVVLIRDDRVCVQYFDGPQRDLTPERLRPMNLQVGSRVECRWKGGQRHYPGEIRQKEGDRIYIVYDDGDREWTTIRLVRVAP